MSPALSALENIGVIRLGVDVELAAKATIDLWLPTYLAEIERQRDITPETLETFREYPAINDIEKMLEDQLPCCSLFCEGLNSAPVKRGDGAYEGTFNLKAGIIVSSITVEDTRNLMSIYTAAVRAILIQQRSLGGFAIASEFTNEAYDELPVEDTRTLGVGMLEFSITVGDVSNWKEGPRGTPPTDPYADPEEPVTFDTHNITINLEEL